MAKEWWDILQPSWKKWRRQELAADSSTDGRCRLTIHGSANQHAVIHYENYYLHGEQHHGFYSVKKCDRAVVRKRRDRHLMIDLVEFKRTRRHIDDAEKQLTASKSAITSRLSDAELKTTLEFRLFCAYPNTKSNPRRWKQRHDPHQNQPDTVEWLPCGDELPPLPPPPP